MNRWMLLAARIGTVLVTISMALFLVSLIPAREQTAFLHSGQLASSEFRMIHLPDLTPQMGVHVSVETNDTLTLYMLGVRDDNVTRWISEHKGSDKNYDMLNTQNLIAFLDAHPNVVSRQENVTGETEFEYVPTKVEEASLALANFGNTQVTLECEISVINLVAPREKMRMATQIMVPTGLLLAVPWIGFSWKEKRGKSGTILS